MCLPPHWHAAHSPRGVMGALCPGYKSQACACMPCIPAHLCALGPYCCLSHQVHLLFLPLASCALNRSNKGLGHRAEPCSQKTLHVRQLKGLPLDPGSVAQEEEDLCRVRENSFLFHLPQ